MVSKNNGLVETDRKSSWHDAIIERGMACLVICSPLAMACVPVWASSTMIIGVFIIFSVWIHKVSAGSTVILEAGVFLKLFILFICLSALQLLPVPLNILEAVAPGAASLYDVIAKENPGQWHPISIYPDATLNELVKLLAYGAVFLVVSNHYRQRSQIVFLAHSIVLSGGLLTAVAILQKVFWNGKIYWFYPLDPMLQQRSSFIFGPYINRNHFAGYLEMVIPLAIGLLLYTQSIRRRSGQSTTFRRFIASLDGRHLTKTTLMVSAIVIMSGMLFATLSRGGILSFATSIMALMVLMHSRNATRRWPIRGLIMIIMIAMISLFGTWDRVESRFIDIPDTNQIMRVTVWADVMNLIKDYPVLGTGLGTFDRAFTRYQSEYSNVYFEHAENDYLEILSDAGFAGFVVAVTIGFLFFINMLRAWIKRKNTLSLTIGVGCLVSCFAMTVHSFIDFNLRIPANALLVFILAGLTVSCMTYNVYIPNGDERA